MPLAENDELGSASCGLLPNRREDQLAILGLAM